MHSVPELRVVARNDAPTRPTRDFVLYWMIAARRPHANFGLQRAVDHAAKLGKPLVVFEPLRAGYRWASDRIHRVVLDGMRDHADHFAATPAAYYPYVEPRHGDASGLLQALAGRACVVVTDDAPVFFLRHMVEAVAPRLDVAVEAIDSIGLLPLRATDHTYKRAHDFRRFLQRDLPAHLDDLPRDDPFDGRDLPPAPDDLLAPHFERWPPASRDLLNGANAALQAIDIDHTIAPVASFTGGFRAAQTRLDAFLDRIDDYADRNHPDEDASSGLSPYLHFGHIGAHQAFRALARRQSWTPEQLGDKATGKREGWWGMSAAAESWLDELITWREVGHNMSHLHADNYDTYDTLPDWAQTTLAQHAGDTRDDLYTPEQFERAQTHDDLWNAAQRQLLIEGRIHNYVRMLWGKKILHWSPSPQSALDTMLHLNNAYALDGRDPNSVSGIFWVLGRYDRAWGPERPIFGKIRYMTSASTQRKLRVKQYLKTYGDGALERSAQNSLF